MSSDDVQKAVGLLRQATSLLGQVIGGTIDGTANGHQPQAVPMVPSRETRDVVQVHRQLFSNCNSNRTAYSINLKYVKIAYRRIPFPGI